MLLDRLQELRELGPRGTAFRVGWELKLRSGLAAKVTPVPPSLKDASLLAAPLGFQRWTSRLPFADPVSTIDAVRERVPAASLERLSRLATDAVQGRILCFGRWFGDYGQPIDWNRNPVNGRRWPPSLPWSQVLTRSHDVGDVKLTWEVARFPHAYLLARAAAFEPARRDELAQALLAQLESFVRANPLAVGVHWASGQEVVFRLLAWLFALDALLVRDAAAARAAELVGAELAAAAAFVEEHIDYARFAVYNNHLLSEALGLYVAGVLLAELPQAAGWREFGRRILDEEATRQVYPDGAYIQLSHNYHRVALQLYLLACAFARAGGERPRPSWTGALERSLDFLVAHQNPSDGRLPNYGANDGALPCPFSSCDFSDLRPTLQAVSVEVRGERLYEPGPWDEMTAWLHGARALDLPLRAPARRSASFRHTGFHVLRSPRDEGTFAAFRCGSIRDRFSQIDMLHLDVWWKGHNVLVDAGSYLYNDREELHAHFLRTGAHNTVSVDGLDQMVHFRRFKSLYWTQAELLGFDVRDDVVVASGEHHGYRRHPGGCTHRRSVALFSDGVVVVVDTVRGEGTHRLRLHWLGGDFPWEARADGMCLGTPQGDYGVRVFGPGAVPLPFTVVAGQEQPMRGWLSRYYGEKVPVPSLVVEQAAALPASFISVLGPGDLELRALDSAGSGRYGLSGSSSHRFQLEDGLIRLSPVGPANSPARSEPPRP